MMNKSGAKVVCAATLAWYLGSYYFRRKASNFWNYLSDQLDRSGSSLAGLYCVVRWLFFDAVYDRDPKRICRAFNYVWDFFPDTRFSARSGIAVLEAAVWHKEKAIADRVLKLIDEKWIVIHSGKTLERLYQLYNWRFGSDIAVATGILSPLTPHDAMLPYVDYYVRGTIAESLKKYDEALRLYRLALKTIPPDSEERRRVEESCNYILNRAAER